ncbi:hypothetical protein [Oxalicibacterium solurbis]|uniref:hypothetical protein n=1 Tax=Oxalicibacterium solurbis TaxID=69280 RepID=UPI00166A91B0|nr:hypothetical protein [Oxalicibacterium solurbis]
MRRIAAIVPLLLAAAGAHAADVSTPVSTPASVSAPLQSAEPPPQLFGKPMVFRGTLGDKQVQLSIRPKNPADEGLEGEYFIFGSSQKVLLAGDGEGDALLLEESENGKDISGQWDGKLEGDTLSGNWTSADFSITRPFVLKVLSTSAPAPAKKATGTR